MMATPPLMDSTMYFLSGEARCLKRILVEAVISASCGIGVSRWACKPRQRRAMASKMVRAGRSMSLFTYSLVSLRTIGRRKLFKDFAEFIFQILVMMERFEFAIGVGSAAGAAVQTAETEVGNHIGGIVLKGVFEKRDRVVGSAGRDEDDGQTGLGLSIDGLQGKCSAVVFLRRFEITFSG